MKTLLRFFVVLSFLVGSSTQLSAQITSIGSGSWSATGTWVGSVLPASTDNVVIAAGHTVTIDDANAVCNTITFGDAAAKLDLSTASSVLSVYGDFTPFSTTHSPFSNWIDGAVLKFAGDAAVQTIGNILNSNTSLTMAFFKTISVDKSAGKVTYAGSTDSKLNVSNSLEIVNGTFEIPSGFDFNGRSFDGSTGSAPTITVYTGGTLTLLGGATQIMQRATGAIGKLTVYGSVTLSTTSTNKLSFSNVDIESGGTLTINTGFNTGLFNPGVLTIKTGGTLFNTTITNVWDATAGVVLNEGGVFRSSSSTTPLPLSFTNNGTFRYSRSALDGSQTILDMDYHRLEISFAGDGTGNKTWTLGANRTITDSLEINNSAKFVLSAVSAQVLNLNGTLRLTSGSLDNSDADVALTLANDVTISRATGTITNAPTFGSSVNLRYTSTVTHVTSGLELPTAT